MSKANKFSFFVAFPVDLLIFIRSILLIITSFERFSLGVIIFNCIALGVSDTCDFQCIGIHCHILQTLEHAIFFFFLIEMMLKMFAMGVVGKGSYLNDGWNRFDMIIVLIGFVTLIKSLSLKLFIFFRASEYFLTNINFTIVRMFRVFRPLRAITRIPGLRLLVSLLIDILPMLANGISTLKIMFLN